MAILYADRSKPFKYPYKYDPQDKKFHSFSYRPPVWEPSKEVIKDVSLYVPTVSNGCMYPCSSGGITGATEPVWSTIEGAATADNDVEFTAKPLDSLLAEGDSITYSAWAHDTGVVIDSEAIIEGILTKFRLTAVPIDVKSVQLVNHITVQRVNGDLEEFDSTIIIQVSSL